MHARARAVRGRHTAGAAEQSLGRAASMRARSAHCRRSAHLGVKLDVALVRVRDVGEIGRVPLDPVAAVRAVGVRYDKRELFLLTRAAEHAKPRALDRAHDAGFDHAHVDEVVAGAALVARAVSAAGARGGRARRNDDANAAIGRRIAHGRRPGRQLLRRERAADPSGWLLRATRAEGGMRGKQRRTAAAAAASGLPSAVAFGGEGREDQHVITIMKLIGFALKAPRRRRLVNCPESRPQPAAGNPDDVLAQPLLIARDLDRLDQVVKELVPAAGARERPRRARARRRRGGHAGDAAASRTFAAAVARADGAAGASDIACAAARASAAGAGAARAGRSGGGARALQLGGAVRAHAILATKFQLAAAAATAAASAAAAPAAAGAARHARVPSRKRRAVRPQSSLFRLQPIRPVPARPAAAVRALGRSRVLGGGQRGHPPQPQPDQAIVHADHRAVAAAADVPAVLEMLNVVIELLRLRLWRRLRAGRLLAL